MKKNTLWDVISGLFALYVAIVFVDIASIMFKMYILRIH